MLRLENLTKAFAGGKPVVDVPAFNLAAGEQVALRGASGTGKTTFLHLIAGIHEADTGVVALGGIDLARLKEAARDRVRAQQIGYVFQTFNLLQGLTVAENVALAVTLGGRKVAPGQVEGILGRVGLAERGGAFPRELSTGQQQRVAVARALVKRPQLVLADEPTGNLDPARAGEVLSLMREVCREVGAALLLVSHDEAVLARFETVIDFRELNRRALV